LLTVAGPLESELHLFVNKVNIWK